MLAQHQTPTRLRPSTSAGKALAGANENMACKEKNKNIQKLNLAKKLNLDLDSEYFLVAVDNFSFRKRFLFSMVVLGRKDQ